EARTASAEPAALPPPPPPGEQALASREATGERDAPAEPGRKPLSAASPEPPAATPLSIEGAPETGPAAPPRGPAVEISASGAMVADIQRRLKEEGFDPGPIDGLAGPRTRDAIRSYQRRMNLPVTGRIDETVRRQLMARQPSAGPDPTTLARLA